MPKTPRLLLPPIRIVVDTTRKCNLKCWYCHSASGSNYKGPEVSGENIRDIFRAAESNSVFEVTLTGGEPLMWSGLDEAMRVSRSLSYTSVQLITNATILSQQKVDILKSGNLKRICVSLDGAKEIHERNRGRGTYSQTLKGISQLRKVVDNLTVISVIDNTNYDKWPKLTNILQNMGIKQHHLTPVCFAGDAISQFRGLSEQQFEEVRSAVEELSQRLPAEFILKFNDVLVNGLEGRQMSLQAFTEFAKGWYVVVRPGGEVNASVRAWGRSWRRNETVGNINNQGMDQLLDIYRERRELFVSSKFDSEEERRRKFHLGSITDQQIATDVNAVKSVDGGEEVSYEESVEDKDDGIADILDIDNYGLLNLLLQEVAQNPGRFRLRAKDNFGLLFDTVTFNVTVLNSFETKRVMSVLI